MKKIIFILAICIGSITVMSQCIGDAVLKPNPEFISIKESGEQLIKDYKGEGVDADYLRVFSLGFEYNYGKLSFNQFSIDVEEIKLFGELGDEFIIFFPLPFDYDFDHYMDQVDEVEVYFQNEMEGVDSVAVIEIRNLNFEDNTGSGRIHIQYRVSQRGHIDYIVENSISPYDVLIDWWYLKENRFITSLTLDWSEQSSELATVCFQDERSAQDHGYMIKNFPTGLTHFIFGKSLSTSVIGFEKSSYTFRVNGANVSIDLMGYQPEDAKVISYDGRVVKSFKDLKRFGSGIYFEDIPKGAYIISLDNNYLGKFIILN